MISEFEKALDFDSDTFKDMKQDMDFILQEIDRHNAGKRCCRGFHDIED